MRDKIIHAIWHQPMQKMGMHLYSESGGNACGCTGVFRHIKGETVSPDSVVDDVTLMDKGQCEQRSSQLQNE